MRAEHRLALPLGRQLEQIGEARNDARAQLLGHYMHGATRFRLGEFVAARAILERCLGIVDPARGTTGGLSVAPFTAILGTLALALAYLGYIDQARLRMDEALSEARQLRHAHTLAHVLAVANWFDWLTCSPERRGEELLSLSTEHGFPLYLAWGLAYRGRSLLALGQAHEGLMLLAKALMELRAAGGVNNTPMPLTWLAEAHAVLGQPTEEQNYLDEAARVIETTDERVSEAELVHRVPGDLLTAAGDRSGAERHYRKAIAVAERQSAKLLQLKASTSLAQLWRDRGKRTEARDLLGPVYNWFTEGFGAPDLKEAKALLDELA